MDVSSLQQVPLFQGVELPDLQALMTLMQQQKYAAEEIIFEKGSRGESMYIVLAGRVRIYLEDELGNELTLIQHDAGEIFGELSLLDQAFRSANAIAEESTSTLILERVDFLAFINERPQVGIAMMRNLAAMLRYSNTFMEQIVEWGNRLVSEVGEYEQVVAEVSKPSLNRQIRELLSAFLQMAESLRNRQLLK